MKCSIPKSFSFSSSGWLGNMDAETSEVVNGEQTVRDLMAIVLAEVNLVGEVLVRKRVRK